MKYSLARDLQENFAPSLDGLGVLVSRQTLLGIPALEFQWFARGTIAEFVSKQFLALRTNEEVDEQQRRMGVLGVRQDSDDPPN